SQSTSPSSAPRSTAAGWSTATATIRSTWSSCCAPSETRSTVARTSPTAATDASGQVARRRRARHGGGARRPRPVPSAHQSDTAGFSCPHRPDCVGCALIGTPYGQQLELKRRRVERALAAHSELRDLEVPRVVGSAKVFGYRNQAKLVARPTRRGLLLGIYR